MKKLFIFTVLSLISNNAIIAQQNPFPGFYAQTKANASNQFQQQRYNDSIKYYKLDIEKLNDYVFDALNSVKMTYGLNPVIRYENTALIDSCDAFANYLVTNNLIGHGRGNYNAEICYVGFADMNNTLKNDIEADIYKKIASDMIAGWMSSAPHKAIILKNDYTKVIVSTAKDDLNQINNLCGFDLRGVIRFYK
jgi:uncharacterized protein YkwD